MTVASTHPSVVQPQQTNALDPVCAKDQIELRIEKSVRPKFQNDRLEVSSVLPVIVRLERVDMLPAHVFTVA